MVGSVRPDHSSGDSHSFYDSNRYLPSSPSPVYCLDQREIPDDEFYAVQKATKTLASRGVSNPGSLHYRQVDVRDTDALERVTASIVSTHNRIDGLVAAAAIQQITPAVEYTVNDVCRMIDVNFTGTFMSATAVARKMMDHKFNGSIVLVASMSGFVANKGLLSPVYNSSKAALIQLARNLAMEWGKHGIRVNSLCPGHVITPMVERNFEEAPGLKETWEVSCVILSWFLTALKPANCSQGIFVEVS